MGWTQAALFLSFVIQVAALAKTCRGSGLILFPGNPKSWLVLRITMRAVNRGKHPVVGGCELAFVEAPDLGSLFPPTPIRPHLLKG